jgi:hypothetical protein
MKLFYYIHTPVYFQTTYKMSSQQQQSNITPLMSNLDLYISRANTTEDQVKALFFQSRIGTVEWCKFVMTENPPYASVFIKLRCWSPSSGACEDFARNKTIRLQIGDNSREFWTILPSPSAPPEKINTDADIPTQDEDFDTFLISEYELKLPIFPRSTAIFNSVEDKF